MSSQNIDRIVTALKSLKVSDDFIRGSLFLMGGVILIPDKQGMFEGVRNAIQWVTPHDPEMDGSRLLDKIDDRILSNIFENFLFVIDGEIPFRDIIANEKILHLFSPQDHGLFEIDIPIMKLQPFSELYFCLSACIGRSLKDFGVDGSDCFIAGVSCFSTWLNIDRMAVSHILNFLKNSKPPILAMIYRIPININRDESKYLPSQMVYHYLISKWHEDIIIDVAWPYQSFIFYKGGEQIPTVENYDPAEFLIHAYRKTIDFYEEYWPSVRQAASRFDEFDDIPAFTGTGTERQMLIDYIYDVWGYEIENVSLSYLHNKQINGCIIYVLFLSMCKAEILN